MSRIWVIGGTVETYKVCDELLHNNKDIIVSVATDYGYEEFAKFKQFLVKGRMDKMQMIEFCQNNCINKIVDVSHPYAKDVSKNAMEVSDELCIKYYRYERTDTQFLQKYDKMYYADDHADAINLAKKFNFKRVFLTTGIKDVDKYINANFDELFIRILPRSEQIAYLENKGYKSKNIIAMQGPFTKNMNIETIKHINADVMITKQSGKEGGFDEKVSSCIDTEISVIIIKRPLLKYENRFDNIDFMIKNIILGDE